MGCKNILSLFAICFCLTVMYAHGQATLNADGTHTYFVGTNGNDNNEGTIIAPFASLTKAENVIIAGDTVYIRGGRYKVDANIVPVKTEKSGLYADLFVFDKKGTASRRFYFWGYKNERPVFDFSDVKLPGQRITAFCVTGSYYYFRNFEITGVQVTIKEHTQSECIRNAGGNHNTYEYLAMHDGMAIGYYLTQGIDNLVHNCDAYNNWDSVSEGGAGGNVDGFGCHPSGETGMGNRFVACRAWLNSDDGFDLINAYAAVTFDSCWAFYNGYSRDATGKLISRGDGNGFKSGGYGMPDVVTKYPVDSIPRHKIEWCLAYDNKSSGFYANHHLGGNAYLNNTAFDNGANFNMVNRKSAAEDVDVPGYGHELINNISFKPRSSGNDLVNLNESLSTDQNNSFSVPVIAGNDDDFQSLDATELEKPRKVDGSVPDIDFMRLKTDKFVDKGKDIGAPFAGSAPDLGFREITGAPIVVPIDSTLNVDGSHTFFVAPSGDDGQSGTIKAPFATIMFAHSKAVEGDTIYIRGGVYKIAGNTAAATIDHGLYADMNLLDKKGTASKQFYFWGYPDERPIFDYSDVKISGHGVTAFYITGSYYNIKNIEVTGLQVDLTGVNQSAGFRNDRGNHNVYENLSVHDGQANGFFITQGIGNIIRDCDVYRNQEGNIAAGDNGNIDGFICRPSSTGGTGNKIIGCRAWLNSANGFNLTHAFTSVTLDSCWAFDNGYGAPAGFTTTVAFEGGNGFVTGGYGSGATLSSLPSTIPVHVIEQCVAYHNHLAGFTAGDHLGGNQYFNNSSYDNQVNFDMKNRSSPTDATEVPGYGHTLNNNISFAPRRRGADVLNLNNKQSVNNFNTFSKPFRAVVAADFNSLDAKELFSARRLSGKLPLIRFMSLKSHKYVDKGIDVGLPYQGSAPDLGYMEYDKSLTGPGKFADFLYGHLVDGKAVLSWVADGRNCVGIMIEKSFDGLNNWETIERVDPYITGKPMSYVYTDPALLINKAYYRIAQLSGDGKVHYGMTIVLSPLSGQVKPSVRLYPNPVRGGNATVHLMFQQALAEAGALQLFNSFGKKLSDYCLNRGQRQLELKLNNLSPGIYYLQIIVSGKILFQTKLIVK